MPVGPLEDDPWVQGVRAELEAEAVARNWNDFSIPEIAETATEKYVDRITSEVITQVSNDGGTGLYPGPLPFTPVESEVGFDGRGDDAAEVRGCVAADWVTASGEPRGEVTARGIAFRLTRDSAGLVKVDSTVALPDMDCDEGALPIALFTPAPHPTGVTDPHDIVRPDGTRYGEN